MAKCLKSGSNGSCPYDALDGSLFCDRHSNEVALQRNYVLADAQLAEKFERQHGASMLNTLREEVMLLRAMANDRLNMCKTDAERIVAYSQVATWFGTIDKLVTTLNRMEKETSQVLTKETLMEVFRTIVAVISDEVKSLDGYEKVIDAISVRLVPVIEEAANVKGSK